MKSLIIGDSYQKQSACFKIPVTCVHRAHAQTQVCIVITIIRRFDHCPSDEQVIVAVVIESNMEGVEFWDGELIAHCAQAKSAE